MAKTVKFPLTAKGQVWAPGDVVSEAALSRINPDYLEDIEDDGPPEGQEWYDERTVKSVLDGVGDDVDRARFALDQENEREPDRQRSGVIDPLTALLGDDGEDADTDDGQDDDGEGIEDGGGDGE